MFQALGEHCVGGERIGVRFPQAPVIIQIVQSTLQQADNLGLAFCLAAANEVLSLNGREIDLSLVDTALGAESHPHSMVRKWVCSLQRRIADPH